MQMVSWKSPLMVTLLLMLWSKGARRITLEAVVSGPDNQEIAGRQSTDRTPRGLTISVSVHSNMLVTPVRKAILMSLSWTGLGQRLPEKEIKVSFYHFTWKNTFIENETWWRALGVGNRRNPG